MGLVVPQEGELQLLDKMLRAALAVDESYVLQLFQNDYTPDSSATQTSFTEATFDGYSAATLTRANWTASILVSGKAQTSYGSVAQSWTCGVTGNTVFGYWVTGSASGKVLWAERFPVSRTLATNDILNVQPQFVLQSLN